MPKRISRIFATVTLIIFTVMLSACSGNSYRSDPLINSGAFDQAGVDLTDAEVETTSRNFTQEIFTLFPGIAVMNDDQLTKISVPCGEGKQQHITQYIYIDKIYGRENFAKTLQDYTERKNSDNNYQVTMKEELALIGDVSALPFFIGNVSLFERDGYRMQLGVIINPPEHTHDHDDDSINHEGHNHSNETYDGFIIKLFIESPCYLGN